MFISSHGNVLIRSLLLLFFTFYPAAIFSQDTTNQIPDYIDEFEEVWINFMDEPYY